MHPITIFKEWFDNRFDKSEMVLSTVSKDLQPSSRMVLLKFFDETGFIFFSNYESKKAKDIEFSNKASILFYWPEYQKQIRIEGEVFKTENKLSDKYFASRKNEAKISAIVSKQSQQLSSYDLFCEEIKKYSGNIKNKEITRPKHWGGFKLIPNYFEFWEEKEHRRHQRLCFELKKNGWKNFLLYP